MIVEASSGKVFCADAVGVKFQAVLAVHDEAWAMEVKAKSPSLAQ
jgi:hypothetical protein